MYTIVVSGPGSSSAKNRSSGERADTNTRTRSLRPVLRASRSIAMSGTIPEPPPTSNAGVSPSHTNQPPIGPRTSSSSPTSTTSCRNVETSPSASRSTVSSNSFDASSGGDATEYERDAV